MKKQSFWLVAIVLLIELGSCTHDSMETRITQFNKEEVTSKLYNRKFYVDQAFKTQGDQTVDLMKDSILNIYRNVAYIEFFNLFTDQATVYWCGGAPSMDSKFPPPARTFVINWKIERPTGMKIKWNDSKSSMEIESGNFEFFPILSAGKTAFLESMILYDTEEEARNAAIPESLTFKAYETDPNVGAITYTFVLKKLWVYDDSHLSDWKYVIYK